jgi:hypothetical protein
VPTCQKTLSVSAKMHSTSSPIDASMAAANSAGIRRMQVHLAPPSAPASAASGSTSAHASSRTHAEARHSWRLLATVTSLRADGRSAARAQRRGGSVAESRGKVETTIPGGRSGTRPRRRRAPTATPTLRRHARRLWGARPPSALLAAQRKGPPLACQRACAGAAPLAGGSAVSLYGHTSRTEWPKAERKGFGRERLRLRTV